MLLQKRKSGRGAAMYKETTAIPSILRVSVAAAWIGIMSASSASAMTVASWDVTFDSAFDPSTITESGTGGPVTGSATNGFWMNPSKLSWGVPMSPNSTQSSIEIDAPDGNSGPHTILTGLGEVGTSTFTHNNFVQELGSGQLNTVTLNDRLLLNATGSAVTTSLFLDFNINFVETDNDGSHPDDIFVIDVADADFDPNTLTFSQMFQYDDVNEMFGQGEWYVASLKLNGLGFLTDNECDMAGVDDGCIGFTTEEATSSTFDAWFAIDHKPHTEVPEPAALALFGLGLAGLGFMRRRRKA